MAPRALAEVPVQDAAPAVPAPSKAAVVLYLSTATLSGAVMMGLELAAFRLYAPYFGYSIYVWGSMISVVMAALAAGYAIGGRLADRYPPHLALYGAVLAAAAWQLAALYLSPELLPTLAPSGDFLGAGAATVIVFAPSMAALAATGPPLIRLCSLGGRIGSAAGKVYALSTAGGMAGILATSFALLPRAGTQATLRAACAITFAVAAAGLLGRIRHPLLVIAPALAILCSPDLGWSDNTLWTTESAYNLIRVVRQGTRTLLLLNHRASVHTVREEAGPWTGYYYDTFALGPRLAPANRALVLGMGAGASIQALGRAAPNVSIDAVEIDPEVVRAATRWFGIDPADPRLHIYAADARPWLQRHANAYDIVQVDLYQGGPYIPFYLVTEEFFRLVRGHMTADSLLMMNVFDAGRARELLAATAATLRRVFPTVMALPAHNGNYILMAFAQSHTLDSLRARVPGGELAGAWEIHPPPGTPVFTDDRAPVEEMTRRMLAGR
jgi:spermidine synthase